jgi:hypothetical protein
MRQRIAGAEGAAVIGGAALTELALQVGPLVLELAGRDREDDPPAGGRDSGAVEGVASPVGLVGDRVKVHRDRLSPGPKANQLRMLRIAAGQSAKDRLRQETFPPNRDQSFDV